ncbi:MAG: hypothetical protein ACRDY1_11180 [Acidimicrobiales bacterium]
MALAESTMVRPTSRRHRHRRPDRAERLSQLVTWCPGCGWETTLADCVAVSVVTTGTRAHTTWQCPRCAF